MQYKLPCVQFDLKNKAKARHIFFGNGSGVDKALMLIGSVYLRSPGRVRIIALNFLPTCRFLRNLKP